MLGKPIKYELRSSFKKLGILWIAALVMLVANSVVLGLYKAPDVDDSSFSAFMNVAMLIIPVMLLYITCFAVVIMSLVFIVTRFYKGLLKDEGYLMFTLPVTPGQLIVSKGISAFIVQTISFVVAIVPLAVLGVFYPEASIEVFSAFGELFEAMEMRDAIHGILGVLFVLFSSIEIILRLYFCMTLGHLAKKHRVLLAVVIYVGFNYAFSALTTCSQLACACSAANSNADPRVFTLGTLVVSTVFIAILCVVEFIVTRHILTKKLNLE